ncbi:MAG: methyltransferase [Nevskia sp.]|nr:methyltransferase [Nevskia sp.]
MSEPSISADAAPGPHSLLAKLRVVLVEPQHPGNIGACARAMKNFGLRELALVAPLKFPHADASAMASNAGDVLDAAQVYATLPEALADCSRVVASSARPRYISVPVSTPRDWAQRAAQAFAAGDGGRIALLFGRERTGLTNEELERAHELIVIPTGGIDSSLNLAAAVQILSYEIGLAAGAAIPQRIVGDQPVDQTEMERFYEHLQRALIGTRFLDPEHPRLLMRRLRKLFGRAAPSANEMSILRGILTSIEDVLRGFGPRP